MTVDELKARGLRTVARNFKDITGQRFGMLEVIAFSHVANGRTYWICQCDCGVRKAVGASALAQGNTISCGCCRAKRGNPKHGEYRSRLYRIWTGMRSRCNNPNAERYPDYGGRGISICKEWSDYKAFATWAKGNGYADDLTIERRNNDLGYSPANCTWLSRADQNRNRRPAVNSKIPESAIPGIIADSRASQLIAADYGVSFQHICKIKSGARRSLAGVQK